MKANVAPSRVSPGRSAPAAATGHPSGRLTIIAIGVTLIVCVLSLTVGANPISPTRVLSGLLGTDQQAADIVRGSRVPRTVLGLIVGAALGLAGALMQSITRNPLADPGILGVNAGASAAVVTAISVGGLTQPTAYIWFALIGAGVVAVGVYLLGTGGRSSSSPVRLALAGTAVGASLLAYVNAVMILDPWAFTRFRFWDIGTLTGRSLADVGGVLWFLGAGLIVGLLLSRPLNGIALGDEAGTALGVSVAGTRGLTAVAVVLLCGGATAAVGPIAFVGLAVPHLARLLVGVDNRRLLPASVLLGAVLLLTADILGRVIAWPQEVGVGIVTALVGAPVLVLLVRRRQVGRL